jgi:hypothetical protein
MMACLVWKGGSSDAIEKMKRAIGFKFCGFRVKERLMALFCFGKGEVVVSDAGCTVEIESAEFFFFLLIKTRGVVRIVMAGLVRYEFLCFMGVGTVYVNAFFKKISLLKFLPHFCVCGITTYL